MAYEIGWITAAAWYRREWSETITLSDPLVPVGLNIDSVTSFQQSGATTSAPVTVAVKIPAGAVVVALCSLGGNTASDTVTSANLGTFDMRQRTQNSGQSVVFTAVAGGEIAAGEVITYNAGIANQPAMTIVVLTGANTSQLTTVGTNTDNSSSMTVSVTAGAIGSHILGAFQLFTNTTTAAPDANTTELFDTDTSAGDHTWHARRTDVTTATGATVIGGTWGATNTWSASAIEIRPA